MITTAEFCRGKLIERDGIVRHWIEDSTDVFTGGDLLYCGGCCGQHVATRFCNEHLATGESRPLQVQQGNNAGSGCDAWIDCFVRQCQVCLRSLRTVLIRVPRVVPNLPRGGPSPVGWRVTLKSETFSLTCMLQHEI